MSTPLPIVDTLVDPLLLALRDCLCEQVARTSLGPTCRCMVVHGFTSPTMDGCDCECTVEDDPTVTGHGDSWVRLVRLDPDLTDGSLVSGVCAPGWQAVIELGTYRCAPVPEDGQPLEAAVLTAFSMKMGSDRSALLRTVRCCSELRDRDYAVDFYSPLGPSGGCSGGLLQLRVALPSEAGC